MHWLSLDLIGLFSKRPEVKKLGVFSYFAVPFIIFTVCTIYLAINSLNEDENRKANIKIIPEWNCGRCGTQKCIDFFGKTANEKSDQRKCPFEKNEYDGIVKAAVPTTAIVKCSGTDGIISESFEYKGHGSCRSAIYYYGGQKICRYSCLGFGDCSKICPSGAIRIIKGIASINPEKCNSCGLCIEICPKKVISIIPLDSAFVACNSPKTQDDNDNCGLGCNGCKTCVQNSMNGEVSIREGSIIVDAKVKGRWDLLVRKCPRSVLKHAYSKKGFLNNELSISFGKKRKDNNVW